MRKIINTIKFIQNNGIIGFEKECYYRLIDNYYEKYFNVNTKGMVSKEDLGINQHESVEYSAVHYKHIFNMLNKMPLDRKKSTLLDFGCGKGRTIIAAASYQYKKIIGVELSSLIDVAKNNIDRMKHRVTSNIDLKQCNAIDFCVPSEVNIIYFFNPFKGSILKNVIRNINISYKKNQRKIYIIYFNNDHFDRVISDQDWIVKIDQSELHENVSCGLYETILCQ